MSLDVYLTMPRTRARGEHQCNCEFCTINKGDTTEVYWANITHNLNTMADAGGFYKAVWRPDEEGITKASQLIDVLHNAVKDMEARPEFFEQYNSPNGWGLYENFLPWLKRYLNACIEYPEASVRVSR